MTKKVKIGELFVRVPECWAIDKVHEAYFCWRFLYECSFPIFWRRDYFGTLQLFEGVENG